MPQLSANLAAVLYTVSAVLFILALRGLSSPESSRRGNLFGMIGIGIAMVTTFLVAGMGGTGLLFAGGGLAIGGMVKSKLAAFWNWRWAQRLARLHFLVQLLPLQNLMATCLARPSRYLRGI